MIGKDTDEVIQERFDSLLYKCQKDLEQIIKGSDFDFDHVSGMHYICNKISLNRDGLYVDSTKWIKSKKVSINPKHNDDNCLQHAIMIALNHKQIKGNVQRTTTIFPFVDQYEWKDINFPSQAKDWKILKQTINQLLSMFCSFHPKTEKRQVNLKHNQKRQKQVILLMTTDCEK